MPPDTLFVGQNHVYLPSCASTNAAAHQLLLKNNAIEGTVVFTDNQTAGRGQRGNLWEAAPKQNLTFSVILQPVFLPLSQQFYLTICAALAVATVAQAYTTLPIRVKWPNDVYAADRKLAGILIENSASGQRLQHSIVGIGLNVNQTSFSYPRATSLKQLTNRAHLLPDLLAEVCTELERYYLQLRAGQLSQLRAQYLAVLYRYQEPHRYIFEGREQTGTIIGIDDAGRLALQIGQKVVYPDLKEVTYCFD